jgi:hypothetical protein
MKSFVSLLHFLVLFSLCVPFLIYSFLSRSVHNHAGGFLRPRSRSYGRTAALRLIVQPCDEDEEKDDQFFLFFQVTEHRWNEIDRGKPKYSGKNLSKCHFVHHKSHMD